MQFLSNTNIQFISNRKYGYIVSGIVILVGIISLIMNGGPKYNIDFTGGTLIVLEFNQPVKIEDVRSALGSKGYGNSEIKYFDSEKGISIRSGSEKTVEELSKSIEDILEGAFPDNPHEVQIVESVGPKIGKELIWRTVQAIVWAMLLILIYVMWRFEFKFSLGAILALIHDITITIGIFSIFDVEISSTVIAAILTIVGYSLNDSIVVFDRIRENLKIKQKNAGAFLETVNRSLNETLSRTVITSLTTLFVVSILFFFGGEVLRSFALALIIGIIVGTYSSLFIASPTVVELQLRRTAGK